MLKSYKPVTPSSRHTVIVSRSDLSEKKANFHDSLSIFKKKPIKSLVRGKISSGGRNNLGRITTRHKGGGHKKLYRKIDFHRSSRDGFSAVVQRIEYDPNRTAFIALIRYEGSSDLSYIIAPHGIKEGDKVVSGPDVEIKLGNCMPLENIPLGRSIHNIEMKPGKGAQLARSAGASASLVEKDSGYAKVKFSSGEVRLIPIKCRAVIGVVSNLDNKNISYGKAGRRRWLGVRPTVRGVVMNPVDHPHGGGEGKTSGGRHPVTPWGKPTKGKKTRSSSFTSKYIVTFRKSKNR